MHSQLILDKGAKDTHRKSESLFKKWCWKKCISRSKITCITILHNSQNINLTLINALNIRSETIKLLEENINRKLPDICLGNIFFFIYETKSVGTESKINTQEHSSFCKANCTIILSHFSCVPTLLQTYGPQPARLLCPWDSPSKNVRMGYPCLPPGDLPNSGIEPRCLLSPELTGGFLTSSTT